MVVGSSGDFITGAVFADALPSALDALAARAGADGAVLVRSRADVPIAAVASPHILEPVTAYIAGDRPVDLRIARVHPSLGEGFRFDQDDFSFRQIARDPYYQEFLKPRGFGWHACALLAQEPNGEAVHISIKRRFDRGPFARSDVAAVEREIPSLRTALRFVHPLEPGALGFGRSFASTERFAIGFNARGDAFALNNEAKGPDVLTIKDGAIIWSERKEQVSIDALIDKVVRTGRPGALLLIGADGKRWSFRLRRWTGLRSPIAYIAMLGALDTFRDPTAEWIDTTQAMFGFTTAEARVAALVGQGLSVNAVAQRLGLSAGTVRNQLKMVFLKARVSRQIELSLLLSRI
jgi:DNA-binding CsgD family transcriptional regulator